MAVANHSSEDYHPKCIKLSSLCTHFGWGASASSLAATVKISAINMLYFFPPHLKTSPQLLQLFRRMSWRCFLLQKCFVMYKISPDKVMTEFSLLVEPFLECHAVPFLIYRLQGPGRYYRPELEVGPISVFFTCTVTLNARTELPKTLKLNDSSRAAGPSADRCHI